MYCPTMTSRRLFQQRRISNSRMVDRVALWGRDGGNIWQQSRRYILSSEPMRCLSSTFTVRSGTLTANNRKQRLVPIRSSTFNDWNSASKLGNNVKNTLLRSFSTSSLDRRDFRNVDTADSLSDYEVGSFTPETWHEAYNRLEELRDSQEVQDTVMSWKLYERCWVEALSCTDIKTVGEFDFEISAFGTAVSYIYAKDNMPDPRTTEPKLVPDWLYQQRTLNSLLTKWRRAWILNEIDDLLSRRLFEFLVKMNNIQHRQQQQQQQQQVDYDLNFLSKSNLFSVLQVECHRKSISVSLLEDIVQTSLDVYESKSLSAYMPDENMFRLLFLALGKSSMQQLQQQKQISSQTLSSNLTATAKINTPSEDEVVEQKELLLKWIKCASLYIPINMNVLNALFDYIYRVDGSVATAKQAHTILQWLVQSYFDKPHGANTKPDLETIGAVLRIWQCCHKQMDSIEEDYDAIHGSVEQIIDWTKQLYTVKEIQKDELIRPLLSQSLRCFREDNKKLRRHFRWMKDNQLSDTFSYELMLSNCCHYGSADEAYAILEDLVYRYLDGTGSVKPTHRHFVYTILSWSKVPGSKNQGSPTPSAQAKYIVDTLLVPNREQLDLLLTADIYNALLRVIGASSDSSSVSRAEALVGHMMGLAKKGNTLVRPSRDTYHILFKLFKKHGMGHKATLWLERIVKEHEDYYVNTNGRLSRSLSPQLCDQALYAITKAKEPDSGIQAAMMLHKINLLSKRGLVDYKPSLLTYTSIMTRLSRTNYDGIPRQYIARITESLFEKVLTRSREGGHLQPHTEMFHAVMHAWARIGATEKVERLFRRMQDYADNDDQTLVQVDSSAYNIMVKAWALSKSSKSLDNIEAILDELSSKVPLLKVKSSQNYIETTNTLHRNDPDACTSNQTNLLNGQIFETAWIGYKLYNETHFQHNKDPVGRPTNDTTEKDWQPSRPDKMVRTWQKLFVEGKVSKGPSHSVYSQLAQWWQEYPGLTPFDCQQHINDLDALQQEQEEKTKRQN